MRIRTQESTSVAWLLALVLASFVPETWKLHFGIRGWLHWPVHFAAFAVAGILAFRRSGLSARLRRASVLIAVALSLEILESMLFGSTMEWSDVLADSLGILLAMYWR